MSLESLASSSILVNTLVELFSANHLFTYKLSREQRKKMLRRPSFWSRDDLGQNALAMKAGLCLSVLVTLVLIFSKIYDPFFPPTSKLADFLSSDQINTGCGVDEPINCGDPEVSHLLMSAALDKLKDVHFYRFGKPVGGDNGSSCHMAWRFKHKEGGLNKDYRSFRVVRSEECTLSVVGMGEYHSGVNARNSIVGDDIDVDNGETVNGDRLVEEPFSGGKYLVYAGDGDGDSCHDMGHYAWSFMCALGEAEFLNRTLVVDMNICLSKIYSASGVDQGRDFRFYYDFELLKDISSVVDQAEFWLDWNKWSKRDGLKVHLVENSRVTPMKLAEVKDSLIIRKFGEPGDFWHRVCESEAAAVIQQPWYKLQMSRELWRVAAAITTRMSWDYDAVRVERGEMAKNKELWPNLDNDTSPQSVMAALRGRNVEDGRSVYIATDEADTSFFDPLKERYSLHFLDDHRDLWDANSNWYNEMRMLNNGSTLEFDGYMRQRVDDGVFLSAEKQIETFNDLTKDCRARMAGESKSSVEYVKCKTSVTNNVKAYSASSLSSAPSSPLGLRKSKRHNCLCSPTTHAGSFRCRYHRNSKLSDLAGKSSAHIHSTSPSTYLPA